ncbi:hypothetical protein [Ochrobactrum teleogrylli]
MAETEPKGSYTYPNISDDPDRRDVLRNELESGLIRNCASKNIARQLSGWLKLPKETARKALSTRNI